MNRRRTCGTPTILFVLLCATFGWSQASVNEANETAHIYVNASTGSDAATGIATQPYKSLARAIDQANQNNLNGIGTKITVSPGVYRESFTVGRYAKATSAPITMEAATAGTAIISGADKWTGWTASANNPGVYTHAWPYNWGFCPATPGVFEAPITLRREMIFVNGANLTQVLSQSQMAAGTFYVNENSGTVFIQPAPGVNLSSADVEVSTRNNLLTTYNAANFVLRGMTFAMANNCRDSAAAVIFYGGSQVTIDSNQFNWNNAGGLQLSSVNNYTVSNNIANHNGESGFGAMQSKNGTWTNNTANYNTWRGAQGAIYGWNSGGFHFFQQHKNTITGATAMFNQSHGIHWDTDTENVTASGLVLGRNLRDGALVEKNEGPIQITSGNVCNNNRLNLAFDGGIALRASTYVTVSGTTLATNHIQQIPVVGIGNAPIVISNYETGQVYSLQTNNLTMQSNTLTGVSGQQLFNDGFQKGGVWENFKSTLGSDYNNYWNGSQTKPFTVPIPYAGTDVNFDGWRSATGRDAHSTFGQTTAPNCPFSPEGPDFWLVSPDQGAVSINGNSGVVTLTVLGIAGFKGDVTFTQAGAAAIPGASYNFSKSTLTGPGTVTFNIQPGFVVGTYPINFAATSGGVTRTVTVMVTIG